MQLGGLGQRIVSVFRGDAGAGGFRGLVPAPAAGDAAAGKFLKANGMWEIPLGLAIQAWQSKLGGTVYQATVDGVVVAYTTLNSGTYVTFTAKSDSSNPPTTVRQVAKVTVVGGYGTITIPVKKNDYWSVSPASDGSSTDTVWFVPLTA